VKRWAAIAGIALAALAGAFWAGRATAPHPAVHEVASATATIATAKATQTHQDAQPVDVDRKVTRYAPACPAQAGEPTRPPVVASVTEEHVHRGEVVTETSSAEAAQATEQTHLDLTVTPAASPGWAVSVGLEDVLGQRPMRAALRRRLFGPIWVEASAIPSRMQFGAAVAVEW
jgi:uncharacterized membrane protein YccC